MRREKSSSDAADDCSAGPSGQLALLKWLANLSPLSSNCGRWLKVLITRCTKVASWQVSLGTCKLVE